VTSTWACASWGAVRRDDEQPSGASPPRHCDRTQELGPGGERTRRSRRGYPLQHDRVLQNEWDRAVRVPSGCTRASACYARIRTRATCTTPLDETAGGRDTSLITSRLAPHQAAPAFPATAPRGPSSPNAIGRTFTQARSAALEFSHCVFSVAISPPQDMLHTAHNFGIAPGTPRRSSPDSRG
jgi:hypothetical protein